MEIASNNFDIFYNKNHLFGVSSVKYHPPASDFDLKSEAFLILLNHPHKAALKTTKHGLTPT